jgi:2'-5' RNA ligase
VAARRLFFALWPERIWSERLLAAVPTAAGTGADAAGRVVAAMDLHVTLCFLGAVEEALLEPLCQYASGLRATDFELEFDALEYWRRSRVLAATAAQVPSAACALAAMLGEGARALGLRAEERTLRPHVTLVRGLAGWESQAAPAALHPGALPLTPPLRLAARRFYLAQSHELEAATATEPQGGRYARLAGWPLSTPAG